MNNPLDTALHGDAQPRLAGHKQPQAGHRVITSIPSIAQYYISLLYGMLNIDDQHRNPTMNNEHRNPTMNNERSSGWAIN